MKVRIVEPGFFTTVQDLGRYGYAHLGISPAGAADALSLRIANRLVGNADNVPALEMTLLGATLEFEQNATVALTGASCECRAEGSEVPADRAFELSAGTVLQCGGMMSGARSYLAVQGGFDVPRLMGSASTLVAARLGGFRGRQLQGGDVLQVCEQRQQPVRSLRLRTFGAMHPPSLRVTRGPQQDWFTPETFEQFLTGSYIVSEQSDRRGLRLQGPDVRAHNGSELLTEGIALGAIQVPQNGQPIILFVDQQTTGGYPKIANVIAADLHRVGQLRPRDEVRFTEVTITEAMQLLREQERRLAELFAG